MALEIKGLKANMMQLRSIVSDLNTDTASAIEKGAVLKSHVGDLAKEFGEHVSDIEFAAGIMGNSGGSSQALPKPHIGPGASTESAEKPNLPAASQAAPITENAPVNSASPPGGIPPALRWNEHGERLP